MRVPGITGRYTARTGVRRVAGSQPAADLAPFRDTDGNVVSCATGEGDVDQVLYGCRCRQLPRGTEGPPRVGGEVEDAIARDDHRRFGLDRYGMHIDQIRIGSRCDEGCCPPDPRRPASGDNEASGVPEGTGGKRPVLDDDDRERALSLASRGGSRRGTAAATDSIAVRARCRTAVAGASLPRSGTLSVIATTAA